MNANAARMIGETRPERALDAGRTCFSKEKDGKCRLSMETDQGHFFRRAAPFSAVFTE
jgi:hypothetical protein